MYPTTTTPPKKYRVQSTPGGFSLAFGAGDAPFGATFGSLSQQESLAVGAKQLGNGAGRVSANVPGPTTSGLSSGESPIQASYGASRPAPPVLPQVPTQGAIATALVERRPVAPALTSTPAAPSTAPQPYPQQQPASIVQQAPAYEGALKAAIERSMKKADELEAKIKAQQNPYTTSSDAYQARQTYATNGIARNNSGQEGHLRQALLSRGMLGTAAEGAAMAGLGAQHNQSLSDAHMDLRGELDDKSAAWLGDQNNMLARLASGNFSGEQSGYGSLLGQALAARSGDRDHDLNAAKFTYGQTRDTVGDERYGKEFSYQQGRDTQGDARWNSEFEFRKGEATREQSNLQEAISRNDKQQADQAVSNLIGLGFKVAVVAGLTYLFPPAGLAAAPTLLGGGNQGA